MGNLAKRLRVYFLSFFAAASAVAAELEPKTIRDFSAGLDTASDSTLISDGAAQDLENVDVVNGSIVKRLGTLKANSSAIGNSQDVRLVHEYIDSGGTFWMLAVSSNTIYQSSDGGTTFSVGTSGFGISNTTRFQVANAFGNAYFVSNSINVIVFNGTAWSQNTSAPLGVASALYAGRLWIARISTLYGSRVSDATDWTDSGVEDSDALSYLVRNTDGYNITALIPFGSDLLVFKSRSIDRLVTNNDGLNFSLIPVIDNLGTEYPETVKVANNEVIWLAHDGFYSYNGSTIKRISEKIQPSIENLAQLSYANRSYTETLQSQFDQGTSSGVVSTVITDSVVLSTYTATDTSSSDFGAGTLTNVTTTPYSGSLTLSTSAVTNIPNGGFDSGSTSWTITNDGVVRPFTTSSDCRTSTCIEWAEGGSGSYSIPDRLYIALYDLSGNVLTSQRTTDSEGSGYHSHTLDLSAFVGRSVKIGFNVSESGTSATLLSNEFFCVGGIITYYGQTASVGGFHRQWIDDVTLNVGTNTLGTFVSQAFNTGFQNNGGWLAAAPTYTLNGQNMAFYTQASSNGSSWDARVALSTTTWIPASTAKQYIRYQVEFSTNSTGTGLPLLSDFTVAARRSYGRYRSQHISLSGITSWSNFVGDGTANGGNLTFEVYTDTDTTMPFVNGVLTQYVSSQTITSGAVPTIATAAYAVVGATFSITAATQAPQMDDFTLAWNEGNPSLFPAGLFWNQTYYCALAVSSSTQNDTIFVFDRNGAWTKYTGLPVRSFRTFRNRPYFGTAGDGYIVRMNVLDRYRDYNDSAISSFWISKDFDLGYPITTKSLLRYYITGRSDTDGSLTMSYGVDRGSLTSSTYSQSATGFWRTTVKPTSLTYSEGIQHRFKFSNSTIDSPMSVLSITGRWNLNTNP